MRFPLKSSVLTLMIASSFSFQAFGFDLRSTTGQKVIQVTPAVVDEQVGANIELCKYNVATKTSSDCKNISRYRTFYTQAEITALDSKLGGSSTFMRFRTTLAGTTAGGMVGVILVGGLSGILTVVSGGTVLLVATVAGGVAGYSASGSETNHLGVLQRSVVADKDETVESAEFEEALSALRDELEAMK